MMKEYFVYILRCADDSFYTGITHDYQKRCAEHAEGTDASCYTFRRRPLQLVYVATFSEVMDAIAFEKQVKGWSKKKKEALIRGDQGMLERGAWSMYRKRIDHYSHIVCARIQCVMVSSTNHDTRGCHPSSGSG